jgi:hypothetical protein
MNSLISVVAAIPAILVVGGFSFAEAAPVTYRFSTDAAAFGGPSTGGGPAPSLSLFAGGVSGTFVYDSAAPRAATNPDGSFTYRGFTPSSETGVATSLSNLSATVAGQAISDVSGATMVGNDTFGSPPGDIFQFLFDPGLTGTARRNYSGVNVEGFTNFAIRMFWIEGQSTAPGFTIPDFLSNQNLLATPPSFTGRLSLDFIQTGNPAATSFMLFDGLTVQPVIGAIPEPETYALMLAGLGLLGFVARRKRRVLAE